MPISLNPGIRTLILKYNQFHTVDASFNFYPNLEMVDLSHNGIVTVPGKSFKSQRLLQDLRLNGNKISKLGSDALSGLVAVKTLEIRKNMLTRLPQNLFDDLHSLEILDLSYNQISEIHPLAFQKLSQLRVLRLEENNLEEIPESLKYLTDLVELHLHRNKIKIVKDDHLILPSLSLLDLRNNQIARIESDSFGKMKNLRNLKLSDNKLNSVPTTALSKLDNLEALYLGQNNFFQIEENSLKGLSQLRKLEISGCPALVSIQDSAFSENTNLVDARITSNKMLSLIGASTFSGNPALERVDLSDNRLEMIASSLLTWDKLKHLQISGNPLNCGCENYFLKDVIHQMVNSSESGIRVVRCWSPAVLRDRDLAMIDLDCQVRTSSSIQNTAMTSIVAVSAVLSILLLLSLLILVARLRRSRCREQVPVKDNHILKYPTIKDTNILEYQDREPRYVHNYTLKPNIVSNPYQDNTILVTSTDNGNMMVGTMYTRKPGISSPMLYKDAAGSRPSYGDTGYHDVTTTSNQSNSDSGFSDYKSQISTWSTPHQDNHLPTWNKTMPAHTDQDCHIYADPIVPSQHNQITTLLRFDPKSQYEDPLAF